jgi:RES domain-containing protein
VNLSLWRIVKQKHIATAMTGEGARLYGGRWNSVGQAVVYTPSSGVLAAMEMLVHLERTDLLAAFVLIEVVIPNRLIHSVDPSSLPEDWRESPAPPSLTLIGDDGLSEKRSVALRVPSAIVDVATNVLLNPQHPDFSKISILQPGPFAFDRRHFEKR